MRKIMILILFAAFLAGCEMMYTQKDENEGKEMKYHGEIIDNACVASHRGDFDTMTRNYTKDTALQCTIGYSLFTNKRIMEFDNDSKSVIDEYLKKPDSTLLVQVTVKSTGGKLHLLDIKSE